MIIISSLVISFFIVVQINRYRKYRSDISVIKGLLFIINQMESHASLNPNGLSPGDHMALGILIKSAKILAEKTEKNHIILIARKMSNVYDSLKVKGEQNV